MATNVALDMNVVKPRCDDSRSQPRHDQLVSTLAQRIQHVLKERQWTQRELGIKAGLSPAFVSAFLQRAKGDPDASIGADNLAALAAAAGVSLTWLSKGVGPIEESGADHIDPPSAEGTPGSPRFGSLHNWPGLRATAKALDPALPDWALDEIENSHPLATAPITGAQVAKMARIAMELLPPPAEPPPRRRPTKAERLDAQLAEEKALFDKALKKGGVQPPPEGSAESHELQTRKGK
jgi:transcriptional regulator with XRE-family HTH domain